jgi:hypothetical protein
MSSAESGSGRYEVKLADVIVQTLRRQARNAAQTGQEEALLSAFRQVIERLREAPHDFGEPLYRLPALRMLLCHGVLRPLAVDFGICEDRPLVFIRGIRLLSPYLDR